jgi:outer membrane protein assembly factor BamA
VRYPLEYSWTGSYSEEAPPELAAENYRLARLAFQLRYDTRRQLFFPSRGLDATISADAADPALGSEVQYLRLVGTVRWYLPLTGSTVLAVRGESGFAVPTHGEDDIPLGERFFLGGERSVRSFRESRLGPVDDAGEPVGGLGYNLFSVEVRQRLAGNLSGAIFADVGNISPNRSYSSVAEEGSPAADRGVTDATRRDFLRDFRAGVGVGVRYLFPIGPARFDLAWNPDRREGEDGYVASLSVGIPF